jgi:transposase-like protein
MFTKKQGKEAKMIRYIIPSVGNRLKLERHCPHCGRSGGNIHSGIHYRPISDIKVSSIPQCRMRCPFCKTTWTIRADGIGHGRQRTDKLIALGVVLYMFGLSYRSVERFLPLLDCIGSRSSIERDVAAAGQKVKSLHFAAPRMRVRVLGVDGTGAKMAGKSSGLLFFVDVDRGRLICVEPVNETDSAKVQRHVRKVMAAVGAEQLRTDELHVYDRIVPEGSRKICLAHWRKSKCRRAWRLYRQLTAEGLKFESSDMLRLLGLLKQKPRPPTLPEAIEKLVRRYINCRRGSLWKVNQLLQHIERTWEHVSCAPADATNNTTERVIGLTYKIRVKTTRGMKSMTKILNNCYLAEYLRSHCGVCDLRKVI